MQKNGFDVLVYDLSPLLFNLTSNDDYKNLVVPIHNYSDLEKEINKVKLHSVFVQLFGNSSKTARIIIMLTRLNVNIVKYNTNVIPTKCQSLSIVNKFKKNINHFNFKNFIDTIYYIYLKKIKKIKPPNYVVLGGVKSDTYSENFTKKIWSNTLDYDVFLCKNEQISRIYQDKYCLFLDDYIIYHPDYKMTGKEETFSKIANNYYLKMNNFFNNIEKHYNFKVIIAAHPRSEYEKIGNVWQNRKIYHNKSIELVKYAEFCITHGSTSVNFPILYQKPILFLTLRELEPLYGNIIDAFAEAVGKDKTFIDKEFKKEEIDFKLEINSKKYKIYKEEYIKRFNTVEKNSWQVFADFLKDENAIEK